MPLAISIYSNFFADKIIILGFIRDFVLHLSNFLPLKIQNYWNFPIIIFKILQDFSEEFSFIISKILKYKGLEFSLRKLKDFKFL